VQQFTAQQTKNTWQAPTQKEHEETVQIVVKDRDTFKVTQQMLRIDEETTQKPFRDIDQL
jgi:hypothetical protein